MPFLVQFFSFSCSFRGKLTKIISWRLEHPGSATEMGLKMTVSLYTPSYQNVSDEYLICFEQDLFN